jgi:predicted regulator of Ras-like GTPase activity (Roadblock/LC7/MglB family)
MAIPLVNFVSYWSSIGKGELSGLHRATAYVPVEQLEAALKKGRVAFPWAEFKEWLQGSSLPRLPDSEEIELPLKEVAPMFMQTRRGAQAQRRIEVDQSIPDLFPSKAAPAPDASLVLPRNAPAAAAPATDAATPAAPIPIASIAATAASVPPSGAAIPPNTQTAAGTESTRDAARPIPPAAPLTQGTSKGRPVLEFGEIFGQPQKKEWTLGEVIQKAATLRGVSGALLATGDGLPIASQWPGQVKGETIAGFVPQMFGRLAQYTKELGLNPTDQYTLFVDNLPLQIFRAGPNYFAVLGRTGESLPKAQLTALAIRLEKS